MRRVLNLGHTIGHVLESYHGWPHGLCVVLGILFSVRWSYHLDLMREDSYVKISNLIEEFWPQQNLASHLAEVPLSVLKKKLLKDKKLTSKSEIDFIFIQKIGLVVRRRVKVEAILEEVKRQIEEY